MANIGSNILNTMSGFTLLIGIVECFFGYRMLKIILGITGFIVIGWLCAGFVNEIFGNHPVIALIAGLIGGVIGSAMMVGFFVFGVFILGAILGLITGQDISTIILGSVNPLIVIPLVIIGGIAAIIMYKSMIIISTSFIGAYLIGFSIGKFIGLQNTIFRFHHFNGLRETGGQSLIMLLFCILVGIAGIIVQNKYTTTSAKPGQYEESKGR
jgi:Domain of unknown function (DUF4203)